MWSNRMADNCYRKPAIQIANKILEFYIVWIMSMSNINIARTESVKDIVNVNKLSPYFCSENISTKSDDV